MKINPEFLSDGGFRYEYIGHSYKNLTKVQYFTLRSFIAQEKYRKQNKNKNKIKKIKKLVNLYHGPALVLANGPSLVNINENVIKEFSKNKALFTINNFLNSKFTHSIIPTYHFICDNAYWNINDNAKVDYRDKIKKIQSRNDMILVQPDHQTDYLNKNTLYIRKNPLTGFTKSIDITKVNGLPNYTIYFAIATAIYLGYSPVYVAGLDLDYYKFIDYNNNLGWVLKEHHFYNSDSYSIDSWQYRDTLLRILNSNMSMIYYLKLFQKYDVRLVADQRVSTSLNNTRIYEFNNYLK